MFISLIPYLHEELKGVWRVKKSSFLAEWPWKRDYRILYSKRVGMVSSQDQGLMKLDCFSVWSFGLRFVLPGFYGSKLIVRLSSLLISQQQQQQQKRSSLLSSSFFGGVQTIYKWKKNNAYIRVKTYLPHPSPWSANVMKAPQMCVFGCNTAKLKWNLQQNR